jgi:trehalose 6-phosphate phosphatase
MGTAVYASAASRCCTGFTTVKVTLYPDVTSAVLGRLLAHEMEPLAILPGKMVMEITRRFQTKATAVQDFMGHTPFAGRKPVFLGDDVTDQDALAVCARLGGRAAPVGEDTPLHRAVFPSPEEVRRWLSAQLA